MSVCMFRNTAYAHATHARRSAAIHVQIHNQNHKQITDDLRGSSTAAHVVEVLYTHARMHARRQAHTHTHPLIYWYTSTQIHLYIGIHTHTHTHTHIHIHTHTHS
jgi:hypothetical protein